MIRQDTATRARLSDLLYDLSHFTADAARGTDHDSLLRCLGPLTKGEAVPADRGRHYLLLAEHLARQATDIALLCGQIAGGRAVEEAQARTSEQAAVAPDLAERIAAFQHRGDAGALVQALSDPPPADRTLAGAARNGTPEQRL